MRSIMGLALLSGCLFGACASQGGSGGSQPGRRDVITRVEIDSMTAQTAYEVVSRRRPDFLTRRTQGNIVVVYAWVYVDGRLAGNVNMLHDMPAELVAEIRFVNGDQATMRYGGDHVAGAIEIKTVSKKQE